MEKFFKEKSLTPFAALIMVIAVAAVSVGACLLIGGTPDTAPAMAQSHSVDELYRSATLDAVLAEEDELEKLVSLNKDDAMTTWDDSGERVLLVSWNKKPDYYVAGTTLSLKGDVWTFTDKEISAWYKEEGKNADDITLRLKQLIGLPPQSAYTHFSGFWVKPEDVVRPAYQSDATENEMTVSFGDEVDEAYKAWFDDNALWSYLYSMYPWTRLGYTYDWVESDKEYGLTEFLINKGAEVEVAFTCTTDEFVDMMK